MGRARWPWAAWALVLLAPGCRFGAPAPRSAAGEEILDLYRVFFWAAIVVGGITYALILWAAIRYRRRKDDESLPRQVRYHVPLEVTYTVLPVLIVIGLFVGTFRTEQRVDRLDPSPAVTVDATGFQWQWAFDYPELGISVVGLPGAVPTMVVPVGETVRVNLRADDVIHAFFIPEFLFKRDNIPGQTNSFDLLIRRAGTFRGECAEYCGLNHDAMTFFVRAVPPEEFEAWVAGRRSGATP